jgi:hypothetical protein
MGTMMKYNSVQRIWEGYSCEWIDLHAIPEITSVHPFEVDIWSRRSLQGFGQSACGNFKPVLQMAVK